MQTSRNSSRKGVKQWTTRRKDLSSVPSVIWRIICTGNAGWVKMSYAIIVVEGAGDHLFEYLGYIEIVLIVSGHSDVSKIRQYDHIYPMLS